MKKLLGITLVAVASACLSGCEKDAPPPPPVVETKSSATPAPEESASSIAPEKPREITPMEQSQAAYLTLQVQEFAAKNGRVPADLNELVAAKMLPKIPQAPRGFA